MSAAKNAASSAGSPSADRAIVSPRSRSATGVLDRDEAVRRGVGRGDQRDRGHPVAEQHPAGHRVRAAAGAAEDREPVHAEAG